MNVAPGAWRYALPALLAAPFALLYSVLVGVLALILAGAILAFFRDPDRTTPPTGIVAPADGRVSVLRDSDGQVRLGIFMNVWNVHVVRSPFDGTVDTVEHVAGAFKPAFSKDSDRNERVYLRYRATDEPLHQRGSPLVDETPLSSDEDDANREDDPTDHDTATESAVTDPIDREFVESVETPAHNVDESTDSTDRTVVLIAGAFARRIHPYVEPGDTLSRGDRIGHIAFGSRVDVVFPPAVSLDDIAVERGERVTSGETVILEHDAEYQTR